MKICVIGLGSMGKRRIRLLQEHQDMEIIGIDTNEERCRETKKLHNIRTCNSLDEAVQTWGVTSAFVCTSPLSHHAIIKNCLLYNLHVFTEINLVDDGYEENMQLAKDKGLVLFLSSTFLYRPEIKYIIERAGQSKSLNNYIYHIGQYLPDWHPWEKYQNFFVGDKRTNGCREIMGIELPWLVSCFGKVKQVHVVKSKNTSLKIDYPDSYQILLHHENGVNGVLAVDVVARKAVRKLDVYGEDIYLTWNGTSDSLVDFSVVEKTDKTINLGTDEHLSNYAAFISENPYRYEINAFLEAVAGDSSLIKWDFERDREVIALLNRIER